MSVPLLLLVVYLVSHQKLQWHAVQEAQVVAHHQPPSTPGSSTTTVAFAEAEAVNTPRLKHESVEHFADRKSYTRRLDFAVADACEANVSSSALGEEEELFCGSPPGDGDASASVSLLQYNVFRMGERGTSELIGAWLGTRVDDYVSLNELNGFHNESEFEAWGRRFGFAKAFLLQAPSNYNVGFLARSDESCRKVAADLNGFAHGVLHVECGPPDAPRTFFVTHLTPFDVASRAHEVVSIAKKAWNALEDRGPRASVAVCGDLNSPPRLAPYVHSIPAELGSLTNVELKKRLVRKFIDAAGIEWT